MSAVNSSGEPKLLSLEATPVHCLNEGEKGFLECPVGQSIVVKSAVWSTNVCTDDRTSFPGGSRFDRTETLLHLCDGFTNCLLHPVKARGSTADYYTFLGHPVANQKYSLTVMASCVPRELHVVGRKQVDSVTSKEHDINIGCNEDELIYFSTARVDGIKDKVYCSASILPQVAHCHMKNNCQILKSVLQSTNTVNKHPYCPFKVAILTYYCRKPEPPAFFDAVTTGNTTKYVLYAEQDASVVASLPWNKLLHVESAVWAPVSESSDTKLTKDRLELLKFLCEQRNVCSFRPRRTSSGYTDQSLYDVHFGGITGTTDKFALKAEFSTLQLSSSPQGAKDVTAVMNQPLKLDCNDGGVVNVVHAVYGRKNATKSVDTFQEGAYVKGFTRFLDKFCYNKKTCTWPADLYYDSNNRSYRQEDFEIRARYTCKKFADIPSLVDLPTGGDPSFLEVDDGQGTTPKKEIILPVVFKASSVLFINLELNATAYLLVGDFLKLTFPTVTGGQLEATLVKPAGESWTHQVAVNSTRFLLTVVFLSNRSLNCVVDVLHDGAEENFRHVINVESGNDIFKMPLSLMDVVTAKGGITSMRVYYK